VTIRPIRPDDADRLRELRLEALRTCPIALTADLGEAESRPPEWWRDKAEQSVGAGAALIVLAETDAADPGGAGRLAGMAGVWASRNPKLAHAGTLWGVFVGPAFRGTGVGSRLVRACVDWAREKPLAVVRLGVSAGNDAAVRCYERCGFVPYGVEPMTVKWDGRYYDELLMALRL
jgi:RimJ/RimL family protein N-acetyltransferase